MRMKKAIAILIFFFIIIEILIINSYAQPVSKPPITIVGGDEKIDAIDSLLAVVQFAGTGIALISVSILGVKYLFASPDGKADIKNQAIPIVIGAALLFGAVKIATMIESVGNSLGG